MGAAPASFAGSRVLLRSTALLSALDIDINSDDDRFRYDVDEQKKYMTIS